MLDLWAKVFRNGIIGAVLILATLWIMFYVGLLKKSYSSWQANPDQQSWYRNYTARHWTTIQWLKNEYRIVWNIAPQFPPEAIAPPFSWDFARANWLLLCWIGILYGGAWSFNSARRIVELMGEVSNEMKKEKIKRTMRGEGASNQPTTTSIDIQAEIRTSAEQSGKWWSLNGAIVGGCIGAVLAQAINVWLGLAKP